MRIKGEVVNIQRIRTDALGERFSVHINEVSGVPPDLINEYLSTERLSVLGVGMPLSTATVAYMHRPTEMHVLVYAKDELHAFQLITEHLLEEEQSDAHQG